MFSNKLNKTNIKKNPIINGATVFIPRAPTNFVGKVTALFKPFTIEPLIFPKLFANIFFAPTPIFDDISPVVYLKKFPTVFVQFLTQPTAIDLIW